MAAELRVQPAAVRLVAPGRTRAARPAVPEQTLAVCRAAVPRAVLERMLAARKVVARPVADRMAAARRAVDLPAALQVAVACKAAVLLAAVAPQVGPAHRVAAPRVVAAVIRRPGAEPLAVVPKVLKAAAVLEAAAVTAVR